MKEESVAKRRRGLKGVRKDGRYRRRLSFHYAERILDKVLLGRLF